MGTSVKDHFDFFYFSFQFLVFCLVFFIFDAGGDACGIRLDFLPCGRGDQGGLDEHLGAGKSGRTWRLVVGHDGGAGDRELAFTYLIYYTYTLKRPAALSSQIRFGALDSNVCTG